MNFLDELNPEQLEAVNHINGPAMILAGPGSGKTKVLTNRIAKLILDGADPFNILALTFTNKAAREMRDRIEKVVGTNARNIWMNTFHSIFARILRFEHDRIGYPSNFTIYDTIDSKSVIKGIIAEMGLDDKVYNANNVKNRISSLKNKLMTARAYMNDPLLRQEDIYARRPEFGEIYAKYQVRCFKAGALDFDDLLLKTYELFRDHVDVLNKYQHRFHYVLVDEYQDTNQAQYMIIRKLAAANRNICVVGDDSQSIYGFRGADIQNILDFEKDYPEMKLFKLEQNYRSTKVIVGAANSIIRYNDNRLNKEVWTQNSEGEKIHVLRAITDNEEGRLVADSIFEEKMNSKSRNFDFAILYRTNAQSRSLEEALRRLNIKYKIYGGLSFYQRKEIKDLLAYMKFTVNTQDEEALKRIINYPKRGIGDATVNRLRVFANDHQISTWEAILANISTPSIGKIPGTLINFKDMILSFQAMMDTHDAYQIGEHIAKTSGLLHHLHTDKTVEGIARFDNIQEILNGIKAYVDNPENEYPSLGAFLQEIALYTDADKEDDDKDHVSLMTIHSAKGLEFPFVYICGMEENLFPSSLSINSRTEIEEERRLFYVAVTRAKQKLTLAFSSSRYRWGSLVNNRPSRFLKEIEPALLHLASAKPLATPLTKRIVKNEDTPHKFKPVKVIRKHKPSADFAPSDTSGLEIGMQVEHSLFGMGKVHHITATNGERKALIVFDNSGEKTLLLRYAKLKICG